jgi:isocitrate/isopropylmalate dehydrogenase
LVGGLGLAPGANIGASAAIFEAVHGSAPDIAGKGIADPMSLLLAAALMLEHVGRRDSAQRLRDAIDGVITGTTYEHAISAAAPRRASSPKPSPDVYRQPTPSHAILWRKQ